MKPKLLSVLVFVIGSLEVGLSLFIFFSDSKLNPNPNPNPNLDSDWGILILCLLVLVPLLPHIVLSLCVWGIKSWNWPIVTQVAIFACLVSISGALMLGLIYNELGAALWGGKTPAIRFSTISAIVILIFQYVVMFVFAPVIMFLNSDWKL